MLLASRLDLTTLTLSHITLIHLTLRALTLTIGIQPIMHLTMLLLLSSLLLLQLRNHIQ